MWLFMSDPNNVEDTLTELDQRLTRILERNISFTAEDPPDPDEYRLLKALAEFLPALSGVKCGALEIHSALENVKRSNVIAEIIEQSRRGEERKNSNHKTGR